jgi:hypothetical protein
MERIGRQRTSPPLLPLLTAATSRQQPCPAMVLLALVAVANAAAVAAAVAATPPAAAPAAAASSSPAPAPPTGTLHQTGPSVDVWAAVDTLRRCHHIDVPDIPARAFDDDKGVTHIIDDSTGFTEMNGPSILMNGSATRKCIAAWNETKDPNPANFAGDEFLDSPIAFDNGTVVALVHTEYPGNVYNLTGPSPPECVGKNYPYCWTVTIGLAISHDWGETWQHARPPPHHLVAAVPYKYTQNQLAYGWGDPSNIIKHPKEDYYYAAIWNRNQVGLQAPGICESARSSMSAKRAQKLCC